MKSSTFHFVSLISSKIWTYQGSSTIVIKFESASRS